MALSGKVVVFTGALLMQRKIATQMAENAGATVGSSVTGKTDIVVAGKDAIGTAKIEAAKAKGVTIWDEMQFGKAVAGKGASSAGSSAAGKAKAKAAAKPALSKQPSKDATPLKKKASSEKLGSPPMKKAKGAGGKAVDRDVPGRENRTVYEDYTVKLNQTNVGANNNKFYIIQVLEGDGKYFSWNRWGRVGEPGQNKLSPFGNAAAAIKDFEKKFRDKTGNAWENRDSFKAVTGKYSIVETEEAEGGDDAPMGKLTEAQIAKGQKVLDKLSTELGKKSPQKASLDTFSSEYYTLIPHNFGRKVPPAIVNEEMLQTQMELLKFYLRMGFEEVEEDTGLTPIDGVMSQPLPKSLADCGVGGSSVKSCNSTGAKLAAKLKFKGMTEHLYAAILMYTSNAIYKDLNKCLRDENRGKLKKYFKYLRLLFEALKTLPKSKRTLWRGISVDLFDSPQYQVGQEVVWWSVSSTTADKNVAYNFAKGCGGDSTVFTIETQNSSDISEMTFYSNEKESLLAPGTKLKVTGKKKTGKMTEISLKEVGSVCN